MIFFPIFLYCVIREMIRKHKGDVYFNREILKTLRREYNTKFENYFLVVSWAFIHTLRNTLAEMWQLTLGPQKHNPISQIFQNPTKCPYMQKFDFKIPAHISIHHGSYRAGCLLWVRLTDYRENLPKNRF